MTVNTGVSATLRQPQTFHTFTYQQGGRSLVPLPQKLLLIGTIGTGGTAVAGTIYDVVDPVATDALFTPGSPLALMCRIAMTACGMFGQGPAIQAIGVTQPGAGVARVQTFTFTGPATAAGNSVLRIAGRTFTIGVAAGDSATTIAAAAAAAIGAQKNNLPVTVAAAAGVLTVTHNVKGVGGQDVLLESISNPAGVTNTVAQTTAGTGVSDETAALAAAAGPDYDAIALENHASADVALALAHVTTAWTATEKKWRWVIIGEPGSIGTATTLASGANDRAIVVANYNTCPNLPGEIAAVMGVALLSKSRPNGNWDGMKLPLYPPYDANVPTNTQIELALASGLTILNAIQDPNTRVIQQGVSKIVKYVTTATTVNSQPFEPLRDIAVPRVGAFIARQIDAAFAARFGAQANPDGVLMTDDIVPQVRDMVANILYACQDSKIVKNVDNDIAALVVEPDSSAPGRLNIDVTYTVVLGLHQAAFVHRVTV